MGAALRLKGTSGQGFKEALRVILILGGSQIPNLRWPTCPPSPYKAVTVGHMDPQRQVSRSREVLATASAPAGSGGSGLVLASSWQGYSGLEEACPSRPLQPAGARWLNAIWLWIQNMIRGGEQEGPNCLSLLFSVILQVKPARLPRPVAPIQGETREGGPELSLGWSESSRHSPWTSSVGLGSSPEHGQWGSLFPSQCT